MALFTGTGLAAGSSAQQSGARAIYSAFVLLAEKAPTTKKCGAYTITRGTYTGRATSPDARLVGAVAFQARIVTNGRGAGIATGKLTIRDGRRRIRMRGTLQAVMSSGGYVSGVVAGNVRGPNALLLSTVWMFFQPGLRQATVRLGLYDTPNVAVAYSPPGKCA